MEQQIGEVVIHPLGGQYPWNVLVRVSADDIAAVKDAVVAKYKQFSGSEAPIEAEFLDANVEQWYVKQRQTQSLVGMISILAIIISALGILAMSTYFIGQRRGEIAVRKVFGSSNANIFNKLTRQFLIIIAISFVVAVPIIYYFMNDWLSEFPFSIELRWDIFVTAGVVAFAIAMVTISWKAYQAMTANPVKSLKSE